MNKEDEVITSVETITPEEQKPTVKYSISASVMSDGTVDLQTTGNEPSISELLGLVEFMKLVISAKANEQFGSGFNDQMLNAKLDLILRAAGIIK